MMIKKIKKWLQEEIDMNEGVLNGSDVLSDGTDDIILGRTELAECLLEKIQQWEGKRCINK